jgi:hypothetical protein
MKAKKRFDGGGLPLTPMQTKQMTAKKMAMPGPKKKKVVKKSPGRPMAC